MNNYDVLIVTNGNTENTYNDFEHVTRLERIPNVGEYITINCRTYIVDKVETILNPMGIMYFYKIFVIKLDSNQAVIEPNQQNMPKNPSQDIHTENDDFR